MAKTKTPTIPGTKQTKAVHPKDVKPLNNLFKALANLPWQPQTRDVLLATAFGIDGLVDSTGTSTHGPSDTGTNKPKNPGPQKQTQ